MHIEDLVCRAVELSASDIHISAAHPLAFRIHGELTLDGVIPTTADINMLMKELLPPQLQLVLDSDGQVDFAHTIERMCRIRCNVFRTQGQVVFAIRLIPSEIKSFESLHLPQQMKQFSQLSYGLVLVTGPTGSGKSTTLAALVNEINVNQQKHVITLEDPIEYIHGKGKSIVHQREIGTDMSNFSAGLRAALRQDPDVILVGELRDLETVRTAVTASETGHLVLSTLHTGDAVQTIDRLIDMFPGDQQGQIRSQIAQVLRAVVSQRLVIGADGHSRTAIAEILVNTPAVSNLIRTQKTHQIQSVLQTSKQFGMQTFAMAARDKLAAGEISKDVAQVWSDMSS